MRNTWIGSEPGAAELRRLGGFVALWIILWATVLAQVVAPLQELPFLR